MCGVYVCVLSRNNLKGESEKERNRAGPRGGYITRLSVGVRNQIGSDRDTASSRDSFFCFIFHPLPRLICSSSSISFVLVQFHLSFSKAERHFRIRPVRRCSQRRPLPRSATSPLAEREGERKRDGKRVGERTSRHSGEECFGNQFCRAIHRGESNVGLSKGQRFDIVDNSSCDVNCVYHRVLFREI